MRITLDKEIACNPGDTVYHVGEADAGASGEKFGVKPAAYREVCRDASAIVRRYCPAEKKDPNRDRRLFVKIDSFEWLPLLGLPEIGGIICAFDESDADRLAQDVEVRRLLGRAAFLELPPFMAESSIGKWRKIMAGLCNADAMGLVCQNPGHIPLAHGIRRVRADYLLWCLNRPAQAAIGSLGASHFAYSLEDDWMNIRECASQRGMVYLFTHVPLFVSRIKPALEAGSRVTDRLGRKTFCAEKHGLYYLVAEESVSLFNKRERLEEAGILNFCVDLSFMKPDAAAISELMACYGEKRKFKGSCLFNFKGGLK